MQPLRDTCDNYRLQTAYMCWKVLKRLRKLLPDKPQRELYPAHLDCFIHQHNTRVPSPPPPKLRVAQSKSAMHMPLV